MTPTRHDRFSQKGHENCQDDLDHVVNSSNAGNRRSPFQPFLHFSGDLGNLKMVAAKQDDGFRFRVIHRVMHCQEFDRLAVVGSKPRGVVSDPLPDQD